MRSRLLLIPAAICVSGPALGGAFYLNIEQAQALLFPKGTFTEDFRVLTDAQIKAIETDAEVSVTDRKVRMWHVSTGETFYIDQVIGLNSDVTYAIGISAKGIITGIEILECWEHYDQVRLPEWRAQFKGKRKGTVMDDGGIEKISGTTLSSVHITEGVERILATHAVLAASAKP
jgi:hypothetical protein